MRKETQTAIFTFCSCANKSSRGSGVIGGLYVSYLVFKNVFHETKLTRLSSASSRRPLLRLTQHLLSLYFFLLVVTWFIPDGFSAAAHHQIFMKTHQAPLPPPLHQLSSLHIILTAPLNSVQEYNPTFPTVSLWSHSSREERQSQVQWHSSDSVCRGELCYFNSFFFLIAV